MEGGGIYPLTTADQIIKKDGTKLEVNGQLNIDTLNGISVDRYAIRDLRENDTVATQRVNGYSVLNGAYWNEELYYNGDQFTDVTGGWSANGYTGLSGSNPAVVNNTSLDFYISGWHRIGTVNKVDVSQYSTITFKMKAQNNNTGVHYIYCGCYNNKSDLYSTGRVASNSKTTYSASSDGNFDVTIDVSRLSGSYYIAAYIYTQTNAISIWKAVLS